MSGARAALGYLHVPDADQRVAEYGERKQQMIVRLIEAGDFTAYPDALRFVIAVKDAGLAIADASSSKNATSFLRKIRSTRSRKSRESHPLRRGPASRCWTTWTPTSRGAISRTARPTPRSS